MARPLAVPAVALALLLGGCGDGDADPVADDTTSTSTTAEPPTSSVPETSVPAPESATVVERWLGLLADGDLDAAWELVAPASQEAIGGRSGYDGVASAIAEGWAAFGRSPDLTSTVVGSAGGADLVLLEGTVTREGMTEQALRVVPVHGGLVDPFLDVTEIELPTEAGEAGTFVAYVRSGREARAWADGTPAEEIAREGADGDQAKVTFQGASADIDVVVVAAIDPQGVVVADAVSLGAASPS